jgi:hypothetical protein
LFLIQATFDVLVGVGQGAEKELEARTRAQSMVSNLSCVTSRITIVAVVAMGSQTGESRVMSAIGRASLRRLASSRQPTDRGGVRLTV